MSAEEVDPDVDRILRERARALARPIDDDAASVAAAVLVLRAGHRRLGISLDRVRAVLPPAATARLPAGDHALVGLRVASGDLVAVADAGRLVGAPSSSALHERHVVVVDDPSSPLGLLADAVDGVRDLPVDGLRPLPDDAGLLRGVTDDGLAVLDVDALLADPRLSVAASEATAQTTDQQTGRRS